MIAYLSFINRLSHKSIPLIIMERTDWTIDRKFMKIRLPNRIICVSVYENKRPCNRGSFEKSIPVTT